MIYCGNYGINKRINLKGLCNQISSICSHLHKNTLFSYLHIVKVVCVVKIKLCFTDQLFCNLIMLIK